jgi:hypothetical protein
MPPSCLTASSAHAPAWCGPALRERRTAEAAHNFCARANPALSARWMAADAQHLRDQGFRYDAHLSQYQLALVSPPSSVHASDWHLRMSAWAPIATTHPVQRAPSVDAPIPPTAVTASRLTLPPCPMQGFCAYTHSSALPSARSNGKQHLALTLEAPPPTVDQTAVTQPHRAAARGSAAHGGSDGCHAAPRAAA